MRFVSERRWHLCITVSPRPYEVPQMAPAPDHRRDLVTVLLVSFTTIQDTAPSRVESLRSASVGRGSTYCTQLSPHPSRSSHDRRKDPYSISTRSQLTPPYSTHPIPPYPAGRHCQGLRALISESSVCGHGRRGARVSRARLVAGRRDSLSVEVTPPPMSLEEVAAGTLRCSRCPRDVLVMSS